MLRGHLILGQWCAVNNPSLIPETVGAKIGEGKKREVFEYPGRPDLVVKRLKKSKKRGRVYVSRSANLREKAIYDALNDNSEQRWLAHVYEVSGDGVLLVQERLLPADSVPEDAPDWMFETYLRHWGRSADGSIKLCDFESAEQRKRFVKRFRADIP